MVHGRPQPHDVACFRRDGLTGLSLFVYPFNFLQRQSVSAGRAIVTLVAKATLPRRVFSEVSYSSECWIETAVAEYLATLYRKRDRVSVPFVLFPVSPFPPDLARDETPDMECQA